MNSSIINHLGLNSKSSDEIDPTSLNNMKSKLESYKEVVVFVNKYLQWKKIEDSYVILAITTVLYAVIWKLDIPIVCMFFLGSLFLSIFDYVHTYVMTTPKASKKEWTNTQQGEFDSICKSLVFAKNQIQEAWHCYKLYKQENPFWMCALISSILIFLAVLSSILGDTLFSFLMLNMALYYPGLKANGYVNQAMIYVFSNVTNVLRAFQGKKDKNA